MKIGTPSKPRLDMESDSSPSRLVLQYNGWNWRIIPRIFLTLFFLPFLLFPAAIVIGGIGVLVYRGSIPSAKDLILGTLLGIFILVFVVLFAGFLVLFVSIAGSIFGHWDRIDLDSSNGILSMTYVGQYLWGTQEYRIRLDQVEDLAFSVKGRGTKEEPSLQMKVVYQTEEGEKETLEPRFRVRHADRMEEVMTVGLAVGNLMGFEKYAIPRSDHMETRFVMGAGFEGDSVLKSIPSLGGDFTLTDRSRRELASLPSEVEEIESPDVDLAPFDPDEYRSMMTGYNKPAFSWVPGERVVIDSPGIGTGTLLALSGIMGTVFGVVFSMMIIGPLIKDLALAAGIQLPTWGAGILIGGPMAGGTAYFLSRKYKRRKTVFDWSRETGTFITEANRRTVSFDAIRKFILKGNRLSGGEDSATRYELQVLVDLRRERRTMLWTDRETDRDALYTCTAPMVEDLAEALDVPWNWKGYE